VAGVCVGLCLWLLGSSKGTEARDVALAAVAGLGLYFLFNRRKPLPTS
jgi:APA family basic amino acid/polyamine antiporter